MALTATPAALTADIDFAEDAWSQWHGWLNPITKRWWAARTVPLAQPGSGAMIVSADTYAELLTAVVHGSPASVGV